jgi:Type I phosphodiesterase / nucleotide pyrophosphatase
MTALGESCASLDLSPGVSAWTDSFLDVRCYDTLKVNAILNEIAGKNHLGTAKTKVPEIFGMNFQAVSVGQKLIENGVKGGYLDAEGTPSANLATEIQFVDSSIREIIKALKARGLFQSTLIIITAKHGQSPIDPHRFFPIPGKSGANGQSPATLIANTLPGYIPFSGSPLNPNGIGSTEDVSCYGLLLEATPPRPLISSKRTPRPSGSARFIMSRACDQCWMNRDFPRPVTRARQTLSLLRMWA